MERYENRDGRSPITGFEEGDDFIRIEFRNNTVYLYNEESAGPQNISKMKELAHEGRGLAAFINANKPGYVIREK